MLATIFARSSVGRARNHETKLRGIAAAERDSSAGGGSGGGGRNGGGNDGAPTAGEDNEGGKPELEEGKPVEEDEPDEDP